LEANLRIAQPLAAKSVFSQVFTFVLIAISFIVVSCGSGINVPTIGVTPLTLTIHPGDQQVPLTITLGKSSYSGPVNLTLAGLPSGITFSPLTLTQGQTGTLYVSASVSADIESFHTDGPGDPNVDSRTVALLGAAGSTVQTTPITFIVSLSNPSFAPTASEINLPLVTINTNGTPIADTVTDVPGTITITSPDGQTSYLPNSSDTDNTATFHIHGHTTAEMPKKPYHVKLNTSLDLLHTMGLSCPYVTSSGKATCDKSKSYILLANYDDKTLLRDWAASALANAIPIGNGYLDSPANSPSPSGTSALMPWAPHSLFVELYLNGQYEGNYQLIEEIKVDSHRVNITELTESDTSPSQVTGGYLLEIDAHQDESYVFQTAHGVYMGLVDPDFSPDPEIPAQTNYITDYVNTAETALFSSNYTDPNLGWRAYFDEASAVNFYIVNDVMGNNDGGAFYSSDYLYKDQNNPLLYMGPIWDFDVSSGNVNYNPIVNPTVPWMQTQAVWYTQWFTDPGFKADLTTQWNTLKNNGVFDQWIASINKEAVTLQQSQINNFGRWPMMGVKVWPNPQAAGSYAGELAYLTGWLTLRIAYLDSLFNGKAQTATALAVPGGTVRAGSPATLMAQVTGATIPSGTVSFLSSGVLLGTGSLNGVGVATLTTSSLPAGSVSLQAVYNGNNTQGLSASTAATLTVLPQLINTVTSLEAPEQVSGSSARFTVSVIGYSGSPVPTGTIEFMANGTSLGSTSLSGGIAIFSGNNLPKGDVSVVAVYSGDSTYQGSSSNIVQISVN
jgi:hypothetical protein